MEQYRGKPWPLISALEEYAAEHGIPMLISRAKMELIRDLLAEMKPRPKIIIELGAYVGSSAVGWGTMLEELNDPDAEDIHVYTTELNPDIAKCARDIVSLSGLDNVVTVMEGEASESINKLYAEGKVKPGELDMLFIDHWEKFYVPDLQLCENLKLFHEGSLAIADNTDSPGAPTYLKYVQGGGSGRPDAVSYKTKSHKVEKEARKVCYSSLSPSSKMLTIRQSIVEVSMVVKA